MTEGRSWEDKNYPLALYKLAGINPLCGDEENWHPIQLLNSNLLSA